MVWLQTLHREFEGGDIARLNRVLRNLKSFPGIE